jgi:regulation of enolase protein 1 (concanavalin A-like superfamily)
LPFLTIAFLFFLASASPLLAQQADSSNPDVWTTTNIGTPLLGGGSKSIPCQPNSCPVITVETSAAGWDPADLQTEELTFVHKQLIGDGTVIARFEAPISSAGAQGQPSAGLSVRTSLEPTAAAVSIVRTPSGEVLLYSRGSDGAETRTVRAGAVTGPIWLKLERRASTVSALQSEDGTQWTAVGRARLPHTQTLQVGMVAASANTDAMAMTTATNLRTERTSSLPSGWTAAGIGEQSSSSAAWYRDGTYVIVNSSGAIGGTSDRFGLTYVRVTGDAEIVARVTSTGGPGEAGVMARESLDGDAAFVFAGVAKTNTRVTKRRIAAGVPATAGSTRTVALPFWVKLVRRGADVTTFESTDGTSWAQVSTDTLSLPDSFLLGLAFAGGSANVRGAFDQVSVRALSANKPPQVRIDTPLPNATLVAGTAVAVSASASDPDDRVASVEFYVDGTRIGTDTATPYQATWTAREGARVLTATAIDSEGARTTSSPVTVTVLAASPGPTPTDPDTPGSTPTPDPTPPDSGVPPFVGRAVVQFAPSADHNTSVDRYVLQVFKPDMVTLVATWDLGHPAVSGGICSVDVTDRVAALAPGSYVFSLRAVDDDTHLSSTAVTTTFTR